MSWFNGFGLLLLVLLLVPNFFFAFSHQEGFANAVRNPRMEAWEQVGRFGSFLCMFLRIPAWCTGYWFEGGQAAYRISGLVLVGLYILGWWVFRKESSLRKSLTLSLLPSLLFLSGGVLQGHWLLVLFGTIFAPCHIWISCKNALAQKKQK